MEQEKLEKIAHKVWIHLGSLILYFCSVSAMKGFFFFFSNHVVMSGFTGRTFIFSRYLLSSIC